MSETILTEIDNGVGIITLNRPERHNAFDDALIRELSTSLVRMDTDRDVRVVLGLSIEHQQQVRAGDVMAVDPLTVSAATPLDEVAYAMSDRKVGSAIVNDEQGELLGIFTATDALNALIEVTRSLRR